MRVGFGFRSYVGDGREGTLVEEGQDGQSEWDRWTRAKDDGETAAGWLPSAMGPGCHRLAVGGLGVGAGTWKGSERSTC